MATRPEKPVVTRKPAARAEGKQVKAKHEPAAKTKTKSAAEAPLAAETKLASDSSPLLVIPSAIPWADLKEDLLEELLYWLLDDLGLKDLQWRRGGKTGNAPDGGRDIQGTLYVQTPFGELQPQRWWVEAKGRSGTVEKSAVQKAVYNASGISTIDVVVIATNSQFSNPTRDWVDEWQSAHARPKIWLWQREALERQIINHPSAAARLFSEALSPQGRLELTRARFWQHGLLAGRDDVCRFWDEKAKLVWSPESCIAVAVSEVANGDLEMHPWLAAMSEDSIHEILITSIANILPLHVRAERFGSQVDSLLDDLAYIMLNALRVLGAQRTLECMRSVWRAPPSGSAAPANIAEFFENKVVAPVVETARGELLDVCSEGCERMIVERVSLSDQQVKGYWQRFVFDSKRKEKGPRESLSLEATTRPCRVGLPLDSERLCPLNQRGCSLDDDLPAFHKIVEDIVRRGRLEQETAKPK